MNRGGRLPENPDALVYIGGLRVERLMNPAMISAAIAAGLFLGILLCLEMGYRLGQRAVAKDSKASHEGIGVIEAAVFGLLGLLLGFSFSGATSRLDARRALIVQEANSIGTAYLRVDLVTPSDQPEMRRLLREYVDARIRLYQALPDLRGAELEITRAGQLQQELWLKAVASTRTEPASDAARLFLPALNDMFDVATARSIALHSRLPRLIFTLLILIALLSGVMAGYAMAEGRGRSRLHVLLFAAAIALTVYVVLDLDNPTVGLIRLDRAANALGQVRDSMR